MTFRPRARFDHFEYVAVASASTARDNLFAGSEADLARAGDNSHAAVDGFRRRGRHFRGEDSGQGGAFDAQSRDAIVAAAGAEFDPDRVLRRCAGRVAELLAEEDAVPRPGDHFAGGFAAADRAAGLIAQRDTGRGFLFRQDLGTGIDVPGAGEVQRNGAGKCGALPPTGPVAGQRVATPLAAVDEAVRDRPCPRDATAAEADCKQGDRHRDRRRKARRTQFFN